jgi:hypothetical protein
MQLLNEPNGGPMGVAFLYNSLRAVDRDRLFLIWGHADGDGDTGSWENVIFGPHIYDATGSSLATDRAAIDRDMAQIDEYMHNKNGANVPYFVGEFHVGGDKAVSRESTKYLVQEMNRRGVGWSKWTWKGCDNGDWAFVNLDPSIHIDAMHDTAERIKQASSLAIQSFVCCLHTMRT